MVNLFFWSLVAAVTSQRLFELWLAQRNQKIAFARGGTEHGEDHYPLIVALHVLWLIAWITECEFTGPQLNPYWALFLSFTALAQGLRYWAIASLGSAWNTRIIVIRSTNRITEGPYRFIPHPNYVAVAIELACIPMIFGAWVTALVATMINAIVLLSIRIPAENRALAELR